MNDQLLEHIFKTNKIESVLDLGAGEGRDALLAAEHGAKVVAVDRKPIPVSCKDISNIKWVESFIHEFDIPENAFDLVILKNIVHFLKRDFFMKKLGDTLVRSLRPNGLVYITTFDKQDIVFEKNNAGYYTFDELKEVFNPLIFKEPERETLQDEHPPYGKHQHFLLKYVAQKFPPSY